MSIARISDSIALYDSFHVRENSASRKKLAEHLAHQMRVLVAEHTASQVPLNRYEEVYRRHACSDKGKTFIPVVYQRAIGDAEAGQRANKIKARLAELDPWDPKFWAAQEEVTLSEMRYRFCTAGHHQAPDEANGVPRTEPVKDQAGRRPGLRERCHRQ